MYRSNCTITIASYSLYIANLLYNYISSLQHYNQVFIFVKSSQLRRQV